MRCGVWVWVWVWGSMNCGFGSIYWVRVEKYLAGGGGGMMVGSAFAVWLGKTGNGNVPWVRKMEKRPRRWGEYGAGSGYVGVRVECVIL
jgi:hypothetical protein